MAHRLATNPEAQARREETVRLVLNIMTVREARACSSAHD
jgi:hypothetical protein